MENIMLDTPPSTPKIKTKSKKPVTIPAEEFTETSVKLIDFDTVEQWQPMDWSVCLQQICVIRNRTGWGSPHPPLHLWGIATHTPPSRK